MQGLAQYGNGFLGRLELAQCPSPLLSEVTLVDTPGVLSGEKQRIERTYNFLDVCGWFAARCDLILLLFDPHKLDISDEMKQVAMSFRAEAWALARSLLTLERTCHVSLSHSFLHSQRRRRT